MARRWPVLTLREAGVTLIDCEHRTPPAAASGYPYVAIPQMKQGRLDLSDARRISAEHFAEWTKKARPRADDVILSRRCNPGETVVVPAGLDCALGQNLVLLRADGTKVHSQFLRWLVRGPEWWNQIGMFLNAGAIFDSLKCADVPNFRLSVPPLPEQRAIAGVLGALDDKIEVNRKTARVLEGIARAVFTSWFVDFDPVRRHPHAAASCKAPAAPTLPKPLAALFPTRLVDSVIGEVPEGWRVGKLGEVIEVVGGGTPSTGEPAYWEGGTHAFCTPKDMSSLTAPVMLTTERRVTDAGLAKINSGLLPPGTVVMSSRAPIGYLAITEIPVAVNQGIIAMRCTRGWPASFVLRWCEVHMEQIEANANGSTFQEISKSNFRPIAAVLPDPAVVTAFDRVAAPLHRRVVAFERQSVTLAALRDALLPKLISGELRIADAEKIVGGVV
jgi:type I restriction enzyme S subunit